MCDTDCTIVDIAWVTEDGILPVTLVNLRKFIKIYMFFFFLQTSVRKKVTESYATGRYYFYKNSGI